MAKTGFGDLYRYADNTNKWLMFLGTMGALGEGLTLPLIGTALSKLIMILDKFGSMHCHNDVTVSDSTSVNKYILYMFCICLCGALAAYLEVVCWGRTGERQTAIIKTE